MAAARYTWLLFDADGTLFDYERAERRALERTLAHLGVPMDEATLQAYRRFNAQVWAAFEQGAISALALRFRRFELLFLELGLHIDPAACSDLYLRNLGRETALLPGALGVVRALHGPYRLALVTNGLQEVQRPRFERSALAPYFAQLIISEEVGAAKPHPAYFDAALARIGSPPKEQVLLIGDNWSSDIAGANGYGIDACWYNPGRLAPPGPVKYEIHALEELVGMLLDGR